MSNDSWINMEDRAPEDGQVVITYFEITGIEIAAYSCLEGTEDNVFGRHCFSNKSGWLTDDVTHWMPLPGIPEEFKCL